MPRYTIRAVASTGLYASLQADINRHISHHRTVSGLLRGLIAMDRHSDDWGRSMGRWGRYTIEVDGAEIDHMEMFNIACLVSDYRNAHWRDRRSLTEALEAL